MISINDKSRDGIYSSNMELIDNFTDYSSKNLDFDKPVEIDFLDDEENAKNPLGSTAHYNPDEMKITIYVTGRHLKDILRSISHELIHHVQNCRGDLDHGANKPGYAQDDKHMRGMEHEAYTIGNIMNFRDFEDNYYKITGANRMSAKNKLSKLKEMIKKGVEEVINEEATQTPLQPQDPKDRGTEVYGKYKDVGYSIDRIHGGVTSVRSKVIKIADCRSPYKVAKYIKDQVESNYVNDHELRLLMLGLESCKRNGNLGRVLIYLKPQFFLEKGEVATWGRRGSLATYITGKISMSTSPSYRDRIYKALEGEREILAAALKGSASATADGTQAASGMSSAPAAAPAADGTCPAGYIAGGVNPNGTVICKPAAGGGAGGMSSGGCVDKCPQGSLAQSNQKYPGGVCKQDGRVVAVLKGQGNEAICKNLAGGTASPAGAGASPAGGRRRSGGGRRVYKNCDKEKVIKIRCTGKKVELIQKLLGISVDGKFWTATRRAVKKFQRENKLTPDGAVGDKTFAALKARGGAAKKSGATPAGGAAQAAKAAKAAKAGQAAKKSPLVIIPIKSMIQQILGDKNKAYAEVITRQYVPAQLKKLGKLSKDMTEDEKKKVAQAAVAAYKKDFPKGLQKVPKTADKVVKESIEINFDEFTKTLNEHKNNKLDDRFKKLVKAFKK